MRVGLTLEEIYAKIGKQKTKKVENIKPQTLKKEEPKKAKK